MAERRPTTVGDVETACRTLPDPGWQRIVDEHPDPKHAATLIPVVERDGRAAIVVTRRANSISNGGDWVFPGGLLDVDDNSPQEAARREAAEELGIDVERIRIVGQLDRRGPIITGHIIETYVGIVERGTSFDPEPGEVIDIEIVAIDELLDVRRTRRAPIADAARQAQILANPLGHRPELSDLLHYEIRPGHDLWGMQANMLQELLRHLTGGEHQP